MMASTAPDHADAVPEVCSTLAGGQWSVAWGIGNTAHSYSPQVLSHMVCLSCQQAPKSHQQHSTSQAPAQHSASHAPAQHSMQWATPADLSPGTPIHAVGSPFGVLSPGHFANSVIHGVVSNRWPAGASGSEPGCLLTADMHSMPGMEGSPVFTSQGQLAAVLLPPLLSRAFNAEVRSCLQSAVLRLPSMLMRPDLLSSAIHDKDLLSLPCG